MEITLGYAAPRDLSGLSELWVRCFPPDEEPYARWFYEKFLLPERCPAAFAQGRPVCSCTLMDGTLRRQGEEVPVFYLYALATLPEFRGRGLAGKILDLAQETAERTGRAGVILRPASRSLFQYYGARGYRTDFHLPLYRVADLAARGFTLERAAPPRLEELYRLYLETLKGESCVFLKPRKIFDAVLEDTTEEDGGVQRLSLDGKPLGWCLRQGENVCEFYLSAGTPVPRESFHLEAMYRGPLAFPAPGILGSILE